MPAAPLMCARCGAPLPAATAGNAFVTCAYCNATLKVVGTETSVAKEAPPPEQGGWFERVQKFGDRLEERLDAGEIAYDAICAAAREHLGSMGETDGLARVTLALAVDFDRENGTKTTRDAEVLRRLADSYITACIRLPKLGRETINLPFLANAPDGPKHLNREVTARDFAVLAAREPLREPPPPPPEPEAPKKKGWWPFG
jgi:hypothetical protein